MSGRRGSQIITIAFRLLVRVNLSEWNAWGLLLHYIAYLLYGHADSLHIDKD